MQGSVYNREALMIIVDKLKLSKYIYQPSRTIKSILVHNCFGVHTHAFNKLLAPAIDVASAAESRDM